jgi:hypothetical protein
MQMRMEFLSNYCEKKNISLQENIMDYSEDYICNFSENQAGFTTIKSFPPVLFLQHHLVPSKPPCVLLSSSKRTRTETEKIILGLLYNA